MNSIGHADLINTLNSRYAPNVPVAASLSGVVGTVAVGILQIFSENFSSFLDSGVNLATPSFNAVFFWGCAPDIAAIMAETCLVVNAIAITSLAAYGIFYAVFIYYPNLSQIRLAHEFSVKSTNNTPISVQDIVRTMKICPDNSGVLLDRIDPNGLTRGEIISLMDACNDNYYIFRFLSKLQRFPLSSNALIKIMMKYGDTNISTVLLQYIDPNTLSEQQWKKIEAIINKQNPYTRYLVNRFNDDSIGYDLAKIFLNPFNFETLIKKIDVSRLNEQELGLVALNAPSPNSAKAYLEKIDFFNLPAQWIESILNTIYQHSSYQEFCFIYLNHNLNLRSDPKMLCITQRVIGVEKVREIESLIRMSCNFTILKILDLPKSCPNPEELQSVIYSVFFTPSSTLEEKAWRLAAIRMQFEGKPKMQQAVDQCLFFLLGGDGNPNGEVKVGKEPVAVDLLALQTRSRLMSEDPFSWKQDRQAQAIAGILQSHSNQISDWIWSDSSPATLEANQNWKKLKVKVNETHKQLLQAINALSEMMFYKEADILHRAAEQMKSNINLLLRPGWLANEYTRVRQALEKNEFYKGWKKRNDIQTTIDIFDSIRKTLGARIPLIQFYYAAVDLDGREYTEWENLLTFFKEWLEDVEREDERVLISNAIRHIECCHVNKTRFDKEMRDIAIQIDYPLADLNIASELAVIAAELETCDRQPQLIEESLQFPAIPGIKEYLTFISGVSFDTSPENLKRIIQGADYFDDAELMPLLEIYLGRNIDALLLQAPEKAPPKVNNDATTTGNRIKTFQKPPPSLPTTYRRLNTSQVEGPLKPWVPGLLAYPEQNTARAESSSRIASSSSDAFSIGA